MLRLRQFTLLLEFRIGAKAQIRLALGQQALGILAINRNAIRLAVRRERSARVGTLIPIQAQPFQIIHELRFKARLTAFDISIFNAQNHRATGFAGVEPVDQRRPRISDVQLTGGRGGKANANLGLRCSGWRVGRRRRGSRRGRRSHLAMLSGGVGKEGAYRARTRR